MLFSGWVLQRWCLAVFLLCSPVSSRPIDALSSRIKRSVTHAQLMHDKGRTLQDFKRRMWLQELLDEVHTAEIRDTTGSTLHSKPPGATKNLPISYRLEEEEGTNLPQETNKQTYKDGVLKAPGKKKKKGRSGKRREGEKRKRRARSLTKKKFHL
uniref:Parathyroid hormone-like hormone a n=1 Tax=Amphiprion ocellaris TaxID=80972 RepID=A0A3Q1D031_AMPOC